MADRHLNLFYTYNRDTELVENNLTRAFIVFLSVVSGEARHKILSALLKRSHKTTREPVNVEDLDFTDARFALQSNIDRDLPKNSVRKLLLTVATEPLDISSGIAATAMKLTDEAEDDVGSASVPDAWIYDNGQAYCILIEAKVGSYPLNIGQLQSHAKDWFGSSLENLNSRNSLCSITWVDVLETLRDALNDHSYIDPSEGTLLSHMMEFISFYGYRLFEGIDFSGLYDPLDLTVSNLSAPESDALDLSPYHLASPPEFMLMRWPASSR